MATKKKTPASKAKRKPASAKASAPSTPEDRFAAQALKFIDEAASALRSGVRTGAETTHRTRVAAKKRAHTLIGKASSSLSKALEAGATSLQKAISKV